MTYSLTVTWSTRFLRSSNRYRNAGFLIFLFCFVLVYYNQLLWVLLVLMMVAMWIFWEQIVDKQITTCTIDTVENTLYIWDKVFTIDQFRSFGIRTRWIYKQLCLRYKDGHSLIVTILDETITKEFMDSMVQVLEPEHPYTLSLTDRVFQYLLIV